MSDGFKNTNITYSGFEDKGLTIRVIDKEKGKFVIWKNKQSGESSEAYDGFLDLEIGQTFGASFKEKEKTFVGKDGKNVTYTERTIYSIMPQIAQVAKPIPKPIPQAKYEPVRESNGDFGRRLALHGFVNARLVNNPISQVEQELKQLIKLEDRIEAVLAGKIEISNEITSEEMTTTLQESDVENIPF